MRRRRATATGAALQPARARRLGETPPTHAPPRIRTAVLLAALCCGVYLTNLRCSPFWDTIPARLLPFSILREGNLDLTEFGWLRRLDRVPYFLRRTADGKLLSRYPLATPMLATPIALPAVWWLRHQQIADDDVRFRLVAAVVERITAALIAAASVGLVFLALCRITTPAIATAMALVYGLGSNTWVTSSQALWQHGLAELSLAGLSCLLLAQDTRRTAAVASVFAALAVVARPTMTIFAVLATLFVWRERRTQLVTFLALPVGGALAVAAYNFTAIGSVLGGYSWVTFAAPGVVRLLGLLISPNRGLFIYTPIALLAVPGLLRWRHPRAAWIPYLGVGTLAYLLLYSSFGGWTGGHTYGPRFLIDVFPALALCAVPAVERLISQRPGRVVVATLVAWSVAVQAIGAYGDFDAWNYTPVDVDHGGQRVWDWNDPQIVRAVSGGWHGTDLAPLLWQMLVDPRPALLQPLDHDALAGEIFVEDAQAVRFQAGRLGALTVRVTNHGQSVWPAFSDYGYLDCRVICVWKSGGESIGDGSEGLVLPRNLGPGESAQIRALIRAPTHPGAYELDLSVVQLLDAGKGVYGGAHKSLPVRVE